MNIARINDVLTAVVFASLVSIGGTVVAQDSMSHSNDSMAMDAKVEGSKNIVETAIAAGSFDTLVAAVKAADLVPTLTSDGPFTVFAPNDAAFKKLPEGTLEKLLMPENKEKLKSILTYHVVSGKVNSSAASKLTSATTVNGAKLKIEKKDDGLYVDGAKVIKADIDTSNGIIHVIDKVVMPKEKSSGY